MQLKDENNKRTPAAGTCTECPFGQGESKQTQMDRQDGFSEWDAKGKSVPCQCSQTGVCGNGGILWADNFAHIFYNYLGVEMEKHGNLNLN